MRFSTSPGDLLPDSVSTPRGLALKIFGVTGERLPGSEDDTSRGTFSRQFAADRGSEVPPLASLKRGDCYASRDDG
jgi:hypothetical protein